VNPYNLIISIIKKITINIPKQTIAKRRFKFLFAKPGDIFSYVFNSLELGIITYSDFRRNLRISLILFFIKNSLFFSFALKQKNPPSLSGCGLRYLTPKKLFCKLIRKFNSHLIKCQDGA
jgi:hypothetical protein